MPWNDQSGNIMELPMLSNASEKGKLRDDEDDIVGTQWIETDKNEHLRRTADDKDMLSTKLKDRLAAMDIQ